MPRHRWHGGHGRRLRHHGAPLHRRLFLWFGATIFLVGAAASLVMSALGPARRWNEEVGRLRTFAAGRFAAVWHDPVARRELARAAARDLGVGVEVTDASGGVLERDGPPCSRPDAEIPVTGSSGEPLGTVRACLVRPSRAGRGQLLVALIAAGGTLWIASLFVARRLVRPLRELSRVAREIGDGELQSRVRLGWHQPGEVGALAESINEMASRIEKQLVDQRELVAAVSHEIRAPLSRLRMLVEMLGDRGADRATIAKLEREIVEIDSLVGDLLASSRLDFAQLSLRPLDAAELAREALDRASLPEHVLSVAAADTGIRGDATLIARALSNLLDNATRHGGGVLAMTLRDGEGDALVVEVADAGPGFAPDVLPRAFEPFQRGQAERRGSTSLGLGLALVRRIAEAHGGAANAVNRPEGGAVVSMTLARSGSRPSSAGGSP